MVEPVLHRRFSQYREFSPQPATPKRGGTVGARTVSGGCDSQVYLFDHLSALAILRNEKTAPRIPCLASCRTALE